jgi:hypothetical protein
MEDFWSTVGPALAAFAGFFGWKGLAFWLAGMATYHQMLKRWPRLLAWLLSGVKRAGDAASDAVKS